MKKLSFKNEREEYWRHDFHLVKYRNIDFYFDNISSFAHIH